MANEKSKWFVVATEGATTDGRTINRSWIEQMAKNYDPVNKLGARINLEHFKFWWYDEKEPHSKCYGDVLAVKMEEREDGKLQLLAQISPTPELIELNKKRQKIYSSVEIDTNFADTGEAYLVGLAVTDNPASLGTEMLQFASGAQQNPLALRKTNPNNLFSVAVETILEFEEAEPESATAEDKPSIFAKLKALFSKNQQNQQQQFSEHEQAIELLGQELEKTQEKNTALSAENASLHEQFSQLEQTVQNLQSQLAQVKATPAGSYSQRPQATGENQNPDGRYF